MNFTVCFRIFIVGIALFSMFFGGGNLTFPLWTGIHSTSIPSTILGFQISAVLLPLYGVLVCLYFKGDVERLLGVWGKVVGGLLIFLLLLFWIPLGSGPRCNQLAYGAYCQIGGTLPLWLYSALYSVAVYLVSYRENKIIDILGKILTPIFLLSLGLLIWLGINNANEPHRTFLAPFDFTQLSQAFSAGYFTMDFIASVFFTSTIIALVKAQQKDKFQLSFAANSCFLAVALLSSVYVGMIFLGNVNASILVDVPRDQLLVALGRLMFQEKYHFLIYSVISLSCLTTSMALALVFADYLKHKFFTNGGGHKRCIAISLAINLLLSTVGFESLAVLISYAMGILYPFLLVTTTASFAKEMYVGYAQRIKMAVPKENFE